MTARNWLCIARGTGGAGERVQGTRRSQNNSRTVSTGTGSAAPRAAGSEDGCTKPAARPARVRRRRQHHLLGANFTDETESSQHGGSATSCARAGSAAQEPQTRISAQSVPCARAGAKTRAEPAIAVAAALAGSNGVCHGRGSMRSLVCMPLSDTAESRCQLPACPAGFPRTIDEPGDPGEGKR